MIHCIHVHRDFVVNPISHWMLELANVTCGGYKHNDSKFEASNLPPLPSKKVRSSNESRRQTWRALIHGETRQRELSLGILVPRGWKA